MLRDAGVPYDDICLPLVRMWWRFMPCYRRMLDRVGESRRTTNPMGGERGRTIVPHGHIKGLLELNKGPGFPYARWRRGDLLIHFAGSGWGAERNEKMLKHADISMPRAHWWKRHRHTPLPADLKPLQSGVCAWCEWIESVLTSYALLLRRGRPNTEVLTGYIRLFANLATGRPATEVCDGGFYWVHGSRSDRKC